MVVDAAGNVLRESPVNALEEVGGGTYLAEYNYRGPDRPSMEDNALQAVWVDPQVNLALVANLLARGGGIYNARNTNSSPTVNLVWTIDGDPTTTRLVLLRQNPLEVVPLIHGGEFQGLHASPVILEA